MNNRTQWWIRRPGCGHKSSYNSEQARKPCEDKKLPKTWLFVYLCNYPLSSAISLPLSLSRHKNPDQRQYFTPVLWEREVRENWEWQKLETETLIKDGHVSPGRKYYWCDFRFSTQIKCSLSRDLMFYCCGGLFCWGVFVLCDCVGAGPLLSSIVLIVWRLWTGSQASPPAVHCFQCSVQENEVIVEMSTFRIVIKLCIKYNVTIIEANNTCITSDNIIETKRNCHLSRHLNIENIGMFCN